MKGVAGIAGKVLGVLFLIFALTYYFFPGLIITGAFWAQRHQAGLTKHRMDVDGDTWSYIQGGSGKPLILLHGFGQSKDLWGEIPRSLVQSHRVIIPDIPGFGESSQDPNASYTIPSQAIRLNGFINKKGLHKVALVGISMGGGIAACYAAMYPERTGDLVLLSPFGLLSPEKSYTQIMREKHRDEDRTIVYTSADEFDFLMSLLAQRPPRIPGHIKNHLALENRRSAGLHERIFRNDLMTRENILEQFIPGIRARTLIIWGRDDRLVHVSAVKRYAAAIKKASPVILDDCGHVTYMDQPEKTIAAFTEFLGAH